MKVYIVEIENIVEAVFSDSQIAHKYVMNWAKEEGLKLKHKLNYPDCWMYEFNNDSNIFVSWYEVDKYINEI